MRGRNLILKGTGLFDGIEDDELDVMLKCLETVTCRYSKDDFVYRRGDTTDSIGVILSGSVKIVREDYWGNRTVLSDVGTGRTICAEYACSSDRLDMSIVASEPTEIMFLDIGRAARVCPSSCGFHTRLVRNIISSLARDSLGLNQRLDQISKRTTREKICAYLSDQAHSAGSNDFLITLNRQELAEHLGVDRSAMSTELSRMRRDGIVDFDRNHFILK